MWSSFPLFGSTLILAVMVVASYTFAVSLAAGASGRIKTLQSARLGAYDGMRAPGGQRPRASCSFRCCLTRA